MKPWQTLTFIAFTFCIANCKSDSSPSDADIQQAFSQSRFPEALYIAVPPPGSKAHYNEVLNNPVIYDQGFIPTIRVVINETKSVYEYDKSLLAFLIQNQYLDFKELKQTTIDRYGENDEYYPYAFYTPDGLSRQQKNTDGEFMFKAGVRTYKKKSLYTSYKEKSGRRKLKVFGFDIVYTITPTVSGLDSLKTKEFTGKLEIYKDPNSKHWIVKSLTLSDNGANEILGWIKENYPPYTFPDRSVPSGYVTEQVSCPGENFCWGNNVFEQGVDYRFYRGNTGFNVIPVNSQDYDAVLGVYYVPTGQLAWKIKYGNNGVPETFEHNDNGEAGYYVMKVLNKPSITVDVKK